MRSLRVARVCWRRSAQQRAIATPATSRCIRFWTIGREGEVVGELLRDFERAHPGIRVDVQQMPLTAAHEKLLTAFAGDALPDIGQLGNTWIPELARSARSSRCSRMSTHRRRSRATTTSPASGTRTSSTAQLYGVPWYVDTRLLFYRKDLLARAGFPEPPRDWAEWRARCAAVKANAGAGNYAIFLPLNEFEPLLDSRRAAARSAAARRRHARQLRKRRDSAARSTSTPTCSADGWAPPMSNTEISNVWDEFAQGFFAFYITGPWNVGEFRRRLPAGAAGRLGDRAAARTRTVPAPRSPAAAAS